MIKTWLNGDRAATRKNGRQLVEKVGEWYVENRHLQGCSPLPVSIKDRSIGPHELVLNVPIAY
jgi:hypothetical protein